MSSHAFLRSSAAPRPPAVLFAGGGTGGHVFPAIALAEALRDRHPEARILFVGTNRPLETDSLARAGFAHRVLPVEGLKGRGGWRQAMALCHLPLGLIRAMALVIAHRPDVVVGMGGYSAGPVVLAAWLLRIPVVLCEQNIVAGATNRIAARFARRIYIALPGTDFGRAATKVRLAGNPVRAAIATARSQRANLPPGAGLRVLVLGGSQGARAINAAVIAALDHLQPPQDYRFVHQTGPADHVAVAAAYRDHGIAARTAPFFQDMGDCYAAADLAVCRAGATTVAELAVSGLPALFVPFPFAADDHQVRNVAALAEDGAAEIIDERNLSGRVLAERLAGYAADRQRLEIMSRRMARFGRPDAARRIWDDIFALLAEAGVEFGKPAGRHTAETG